MKKYSLFLSDNLEVADLKENEFGLVLHSSREYLKNNFEKIDFPNLKNGEILERYETCKLIFDRILSIQ